MKEFLIFIFGTKVTVLNNNIRQILQGYATDIKRAIKTKEGLSLKDGTEMKTEKFTKAYYIKLGRGGEWETSSIRENKARIGWNNWTLEEINRGDWDALKIKYRHEYKTDGVATMDINALKKITQSASNDIWITFHKCQLWWCRLGKKGIFKDEISVYRLLSGEWHNHDIKGKPLLISQIPGNIAKVQGFRGTICEIAEVETLRRLINDKPSNAFKSISRNKAKLITEVAMGLEQLHWKDFETLVDLIFRNAGWRRVSLLGEVMKYVDMELVEPITEDKYQVQVKSRATVDEFEKYAQEFSHGIFRKLYFVVHSPDKTLAEFKNTKYEDIELILPKRLAKMIVEFGLTDWLLTKIK